MDAWQPPSSLPPAEGPLVDTFGRVADDLRVSVTDRCNFRCTYCMPAEGLVWLPKHEILTFEELTRLLELFVHRLGIRSVKVTGGEPTVRADLPELIRMFRSSAPEIDLSMTTNGVLLERLAAPLAFIEYMPLDAQHAWEREKVFSSARIVEAIDAVYPLVPDGPDAEPATGYRFADGAPGGIGVIGSVTEPFCESCNRLRITAEGQVRACLFALEETDLRGPLRDGASDDELVTLIRRNVWRKWSGHRINLPDFEQPERSMSAIGG